MVQTSKCGFLEPSIPKMSSKPKLLDFRVSGFTSIRWGRPVNLTGYGRGATERCECIARHGSGTSQLDAVADIVSVKTGSFDAVMPAFRFWEYSC